MQSGHDVAVLIDGAFLGHHIKKNLPKGNYLTADHFADFAHACVRSGNERLFRIYFYDSPPFSGKATHPIHKTTTNFKNAYHDYRQRLLLELSQRDHIAFRSGTLSFVGWRLTRKAVNDLIAGQRTALTADDVRPDFKQKCVDMKIGLDVAWLSSKRIVDRIILVTNDRDFIPPMKHARREGVQVVIVEWSGKYRVVRELRQHADEIRTIAGTSDGKLLLQS